MIDGLMVTMVWWWWWRYIYYDACVSVCHEKWSLPPGSLLWPPEPPITTLYNSMLVLMVPDCFFHGSMSGFLGFQGFWLVFHFSRSVFIVFQGSRVIFQGSRWILWFLKVPGWLFNVPGQFFMVFQGSRFVFHGSKWVFMVFKVPVLIFMFPGGFSG